MSESIEDRIARVATSAADRAGQVLRDHAGSDLQVDFSEQHDVKLQVDRLTEQAIVETVMDAFPDHDILAEESGLAANSADFTWVIDPLDGTVNYLYQLPYYCTSIACFRTTGPAAEADARDNDADATKTGDASTGAGRAGATSSGRGPGAVSGTESLGEPVVGVVYVPPTDELFVGRVGRASTCNDRPIAVKPVDRLAESIVCLGFGKTTAAGGHLRDVLERLVPRVRKLRCMGAAAYDLCNVAAGRLTGFYERGLRTWDIAAGSIILAGAGGAMSAEQTEPTRWRICAAAPGIHEALLEQIDSA